MPYHKDRVEVIVPPIRIKYKKFCKGIYNKYHKQYIYYDNNKPKINIPLLMNILVNNLKPHKNEHYARNKKYEEIDFINGIIDIINNCSYWSRYKGKINGKYLNKRHNEYIKWGVYECLYRIVLLSYYSTNKFNKLKYQSIDSTFIKNLYGTEIYGRCKQYKSKNCTKISTICSKIPYLHAMHVNTVFLEAFGAYFSLSLFRFCEAK